MGDLFKRNWKRLIGTLPTTPGPTEDKDLARKADLSSGGGAWTVIARGIIDTAVGPVSTGTAVAGRSYIIVSLNSTPGSNFSPGDEDELTVLYGLRQSGFTSIPASDVGSLTLSDPSGPRSSFVDIINLVVGNPNAINADSQSFANNDITKIRLFLGDGDITVEHVNGGGNTNGIYLVLEKS